MLRRNRTTPVVLSIVCRNLEDLRGNPKNPRRQSKKQVRQTARSLFQGSLREGLLASALILMCREPVRAIESRTGHETYADRRGTSFVRIEVVP